MVPLKPILNLRIFWDVHFDSLDYEKNASFIIERVFERGHRISDDLDLFSHEPFDADLIVKELIKEFGKRYSTESKTVRWGIFCYIDGFKVDIIYHPHPLVGVIETVQGIRLYSEPDIIAIKLNAILGRAVKKDFWDLNELLMHHSLNLMIAYHEKKFPEQNLLITIPQAITYFEDAEKSAEPRSLKGQTWEGIKKAIQTEVSKYLM